MQLSGPTVFRSMRIQYEKSLGENAIAESSLSSLPKCDCKRVGISRDMRYRNALQPGTIYAVLCGIRN